MKKKLIYVLVIILVLSVTVSQALAGDAGTADITTLGKAVAGKTVKLTISLAEMPPYGDLGVEFAYDANQLKLVGGEWLIPDGGLNNVDVENNQAVWTGARIEAVNGDVLTVEFLVNENVKPGDKITVSCEITARAKGVLASIIDVSAPIEVAAVYTGTCGDNLTWKLDADNVLTISGTGAMWNFEYDTVPWSDSRPDIAKVVIEDGVTSIGNWAFSLCENITNVTIPDSVTVIGENAFKDCSKITEIAIPDGVTSIGTRAFRDCSSITEITIPKSLTVICDEVFSSMSKLSKVTIPEGVKTIGAGAFSHSGVSDIVIPNSVTTIENSAFCWCYELTEIVIPKGVTKIGGFAFGSCFNLGEITFKGNAPEFVMSQYPEEGTVADTFSGVTATVYYPSNKTTWTDSVKQNYGGTLTWVEYTAYTPGDINGDDKVNNRDAARLMQYLAGWDVECVTEAMDVNGDGKVNNRDAARLMQYLAGWDVTIN